jgi:hypothetical protein
MSRWRWDGNHGARDRALAVLCQSIGTVARHK